jgi:hypothetical protein
MKKKTLFLLFFVSILLGSGNMLGAYTYDLGGGSFIDTTNTHQGLNMIVQMNQYLDQITANLSVGQSFTFELGRIKTDETWVNADDLIPRLINGALLFDNSSLPKIMFQGMSTGFSTPPFPLSYALQTEFLQGLNGNISIPPAMLVNLKQKLSLLAGRDGILPAGFSQGWILGWGADIPNAWFGNGQWVLFEPYVLDVYFGHQNTGHFTLELPNPFLTIPFWLGVKPLGHTIEIPLLATITHLSDPKPASVPEPSTIFLLGCGLAGIARFTIRKRPASV